MTEYLCGGSKYLLMGGPGRDYLCLSTPLQGLPDSIEIEGRELPRKAEFHVTLFLTGKIVAAYGIKDPQFIQKMTGAFCEFVSSHPVELTRFTGEFRLAVREERMTVIALCEVSNFAKLVALFNERFGLDVEVPPMHVTLYSRNPNGGIPLLTQDDLATLTRIIPAPVQL